MRPDRHGLTGAASSAAAWQTLPTPAPVPGAIHSVCFRIATGRLQTAALTAARGPEADLGRGSTVRRPEAAREVLGLRGLRAAMSKSTGHRNAKSI
jgi:hypothetical protein